MLGLTLTLVSDWHIGTGTGRHGSADRLVQRDRHDLPFVPAKSLLGVWRDSCELVARALDDGTPGAWTAWLEHLFGGQPGLAESDPRGVVEHPRPAALVLTSLHYSAAVTTALTQKPELRAATTFLKPGVSIGQDSGRALHDMLRLEEMARLGAILTGTAEIAGFDALDDEQRRCAEALLGLGARFLERIGGKRRRGAGRCRLTVDGLAVDLGWLTEVKAPAPPPRWHARIGSAPLPTTRHLSTTEWDVADLRLELRSAVVVQDRIVGNMVRALPFVPGRTLLPAVLARLGSQDAHLAARRGDLVVTNATVEIGRGAGVPLLGAVDGPGTWYIGVAEDGEPVAVGCRLVERTHNTIENSSQRPTQSVGGVYTYEAIPGGTVLRAQVRCPLGLLHAGWQNRLSGTWRVGRSRKDDYGHIEVLATPGTTPRGRSTATNFSVWLLSDTLVRDQRLRPSVDPADLARALGRVLDVELRHLPGGPGERSEICRRDAWHTKWGLPLPTQVGLRAGSVLNFEVTQGTVTPAAVTLLHTQGVGERRAEGFGQVSVDSPLLPFEGTRAETSVPLMSEHQAVAPTAGKSDHLLLEQLQVAAWRSALHRRSEGLAGSAAGREKVLGPSYSQVPLTQLGALRQLVLGLAQMGGEEVDAWLDRLSATERRGASWPEPTRSHLHKLLTRHDVVWETLALHEEDLSVSAADRQHLRDRLWDEAIRVLVSDCLTAHRRSRREGDS